MTSFSGLLRLFRGKLRATDGPDPCWESTAAPSGWGYAQIQINGRAWRGHRLAWEIARGPIPPGLLVCHRCDNRRCVRPEHLFLGTDADNIRDARQKGRLVALPLIVGLAQWSAKLSPEDVLAIRSRFAAGERKADLARSYGVSKTHIGRILANQSRVRGL